MTDLKKAVEATAQPAAKPPSSPTPRPATPPAPQPAGVDNSLQVTALLESLTEAQQRRREIEAQLKRVKKELREEKAETIRAQKASEDVQSSWNTARELLENEKRELNNKFREDKLRLEFNLNKAKTQQARLQTLLNQSRRRESEIRENKDTMAKRHGEESTQHNIQLKKALAKIDPVNWNMRIIDGWKLEESTAALKRIPAGCGIKAHALSEQYLRLDNQNQQLRKQVRLAEATATQAREECNRALNLRDAAIREKETATRAAVEAARERDAAQRKYEIAVAERNEARSSNSADRVLVLLKDIGDLKDDVDYYKNKYYEYRNKKSIKNRD